MGVSWSMGVADDEPTAEVDSVSGMAARAGVLAPLALALMLALESWGLSMLESSMVPLLEFELLSDI